MKHVLKFLFQLGQVLALGGIALSFLVLLTLLVHAEPREGVIVTPGCSVSFDLSQDGQRMLFVAWARVVAGLLSPEAYDSLFDLYEPGSESKHNERQVVAACLGTGV